LFVAIAIHHPAPEHTGDMLAHMHRVIAVTEGTHGLLEFQACQEVQRGALAGYSRWESRADFEAALATISSLADDRRPEWTDEPDELILLELAH
jgi:hypothetical protein